MENEKLPYVKPVAIQFPPASPEYLRLLRLMEKESETYLPIQAEKESEKNEAAE